MQAERRVAIMQPYFFPYLGYFQLMAKVDAFVVLDDVNYINRGWINRNRINVGGAASTFTMPLEQATQNRLICDIDISGAVDWRSRMIKTFRQAYAKASQRERALPLVERIVQYPAANLSDFLLHALCCLRDHLGLATQIIPTSRRYGNAELKAQARIIDICQREKADVYINAIGGQDLYDHASFAEAGIKLQFLNPALPAYATAATAPFVPGLSIIDALMHCDEAELASQLQAGTLS